MSSLRNTVQRRNHKERAQPLERSKWGLLEKRSDYKLRAADHKAKKAKLRALQSKASERNEDEFYFGMVRGASKGGVKQSQRTDGEGKKRGPLSEDVVRLMKTQDVAYLRTVLQRTRRESERYEHELKILEFGVDGKGAETFGIKKVVFDEDGKEVAVVPAAKGQKVPEDEYDEGMDDLMGDLDGLDGLSDLDGGSSSEEEPESSDPAERAKQHRRRVLKRRIEALSQRGDDLDVALQEVEMQRMKSRGATGGINKNGVKFKAKGRKQ